METEARKNGMGPRKELSNISIEPITINNGNKARLQSTLLTEPVLRNPTLEKISSKDRRFSHRARKTTRKTRTTPYVRTIPISKPKISEIVTVEGNAPLEEPRNNTVMEKYKVKKNHTRNGPSISPIFLDFVHSPLV